MCWVSDSSEIVFQLVVVFDFFMCKFLSGAFGSVVTSLQPISNVVVGIKFEELVTDCVTAEDIPGK